MIHYYNTLGSRLAELREKHNLKQKEIAQALQISPQTYSQYECDRRRPDIEMAARLAHFFGVTLDYLVSDEEMVKGQLTSYLAEPVIDLPPEAIEELLDFYTYLQYKYSNSKKS